MKLQLYGIFFLKFCDSPVTFTRVPCVIAANKTNTNMDVEALALMIPILSIVGLFVVIVYLRKYQNQERMAMIEKGVSPELFNKTKRDLNVSGTLRLSLLLIGIGIGFLLGYFLDRSFRMDEMGYFSMLFIFGGLGLGLAYLIETKKVNNG
jgi:hypothetical protein